jgi:Membrane bound O-acyl transferase family
MYGCVPSYLNTIGAYVHYCGCPMTLQYNHREHKYVKASLLDVASHVKWFFIYLSILGALVSLIRPFRYQPFANFQGQPWHLASRLWNPAQLANNFVLGIIFQAFITTAAEGMIATTVLLTGYKCETVMENPMFTATSPSEFWGKRWNRVIHAALKRGVYIPLRKHQVSQALAAGGAFLASGLFHEWILTFVFQPRTHELGADGSCTAPRCYEAPLGGSTAFFIWNALLISLEYSIGGSKLVVQFVNTVPASLRTVVLVMLALPVAHWFVEPYVVSNFFDQAGIGFPLIKEIAKA